MDQQRFDDLARTLSRPPSRRRVLSVLATLSLAPGLAAIVAPADAAGKGKGHRQRKRTTHDNARAKATDQVTAATETCWRTGACLPGTGSNVSRCDLAGSTAFNGLNCTGCNLSRANLRGIDARNATFTKANLSGSCLVDADFTGATFAPTTNLANAVFCRTAMPNGSVNNSGCGNDTACCSTCVPTTCASLGRTCGTTGDGCGGILECGTCGGDCVCSDLPGNSGSICRSRRTPGCIFNCDSCGAGEVCIASNCQTGIACAQACS